MPDKNFRPGCGPGCIRCWRNKLKHGCPQAKAYMKKHKVETLEVTDPIEENNKISVSPKANPSLRASEAGDPSPVPGRYGVIDIVQEPPVPVKFLNNVDGQSFCHNHEPIYKLSKKYNFSLGSFKKWAKANEEVENYYTIGSKKIRYYDEEYIQSMVTEIIKYHP